MHTIGARTNALSLAEARRLAIAAQGLARPRPTGRVDRRHLRRLVAETGVVQIDSVNVVARSQELVLFARLGDHPRALLPDARAAGDLFEYWVHEACHAPVEHHHLHRWRMSRPHPWRGVREFAERRRDYVTQIHRRIAIDGPASARDLAEPRTARGTWWDWGDAKVALECLFWHGEITTARRGSDFARVYDLTERVLPAEVLARPTPQLDDARAELLLLAARHHGVATLDDLADYHRQRQTDVRAIVEGLVADGRLERVQVEGWARPAYRLPGASAPRQVDATALLSPFDPLVWYRPRAERLFGFTYRISIYTPAAQREHGYYVLPFLFGDALVARIDLRADRRRRVLEVPGAFAEPDGVPDGAVEALAGELHAMAAWLDLDAVEVGTRGDLTSSLRDAVGHYARNR